MHQAGLPATCTQPAQVQASCCAVWGSQLTLEAGRSFTRAGAVVMLLHDPSDIFLEAAKICDYAAWELPATGENTEKKRAARACVHA